MLDLAIRKSGDIFSRIGFLAALSVIAMLGLVWLSIALTELLALTVPTPWAPAITGGVLILIAASLYAVLNPSRRAARPAALAASEAKPDELITRATRVAERMAPDSPVMALMVAVAAGWMSVRVPASLTPLLNKLMDEVENAPGGRATG
jgi:hypothetical protein